jgi:Mn-dependent DtxR family transcriptional regulator
MQMPRDRIPEDLRRFLLTSVSSVPFVEALLLFRERRGVPVETGDLARRLYIAEPAAAAIVAELASAHIIQATEGGLHRYEPQAELAGMVELLAAYYRSHLVEVTDLIHAKTARKAQRFADAFRWRKD